MLSAGGSSGEDEQWEGKIKVLVNQMNSVKDIGRETQKKNDEAKSQMKKEMADVKQEITNIKQEVSDMKQEIKKEVNDIKDELLASLVSIKSLLNKWAGVMKKTQDTWTNEMFEK